MILKVLVKIVSLTSKISKIKLALMKRVKIAISMKLKMVIKKKLNMKIMMMVRKRIKITMRIRITLIKMALLKTSLKEKLMNTKK